MNEVKPIDPQELVKWLMALRRAVHAQNMQACANQMWEGACPR
ncbi:hypothetical protein [Pseudomonas sp. RGB]|nr:hypothetical protein [Pseudomonas sp. RGB]